MKYQCKVFFGSKEHEINDFFCSNDIQIISVSSAATQYTVNTVIIYLDVNQVMDNILSEQ